MISNKLLKTQGPSLDLDSIAGQARCTPLKGKPTECGTRCSKILGTEYLRVLEYHPSIRLIYSLPVVVHLFLNNQLRFPPTQTGSWGRSGSRKQLTKTIRSAGALREWTFLFIFLFSHIGPMAPLVDLPYIGPAIVRDRPLPYYMQYPSEWRNEDEAASHCTRKTQKYIKSILLAIFVKRRKIMPLSKKKAKTKTKTRTKKMSRLLV